MKKVLAALIPVMMAGCAPALPDGAAQEYLGVETRMLDGDLVQFVVKMRGAESTDDVEAYAKCAAAGYTLIRGYGFARHVRTLTENKGGIQSADAIYTISPAIPRGNITIDAEVVATACRLDGIPTV